MGNDALTLGRWISDTARTEPGRVAIVDRGVSVGYGELESRASALAMRMREAGYGVGTRIATLSGSTADQVVLLFACAKIGAVLAPMSWRLTSRELATQLQLSEPALLVVEDEFQRLANAATDTIEIVTMGSSGIERAVPEISAEEDPKRRVEDDDPLLMIFTSGSSGRPKAVVLTHANCAWANISLTRANPMRSDDVVLQVLPQFHIAGWNIQPLLALWAGATLVLERTFEPGRALALIERHGVTALMGVPTVFRDIVEHPDFDVRNLASLQTVVVGGGLIDAATLTRLHERDVHPVQGYGLTEAGPNVTIDLGGCNGTSIGKPYPGVDLAVLADGGIHIGPAKGELLVRTPAAFSGYFRNEQATSAAFIDGWLRTGDLVERRADGTVEFLDRIKDIVRSGSETIAPLEVERALVTHPDVRDAAVAGIPHERWGERLVAWIVLEEDVDDDVLIDHLLPQIARFKVPKEFVRVRTIPRTSSGKVLRRVLAATMMQERA
ncbi:MAG TPA: AMP-binding protein [Candidatus Agrococcus pullicola]|uniref:AMP-binding protein n=1 Tax=Candidatus Agrococcus pullicola TaxID=2838429 RepID=A0A9D1YY47_9MICO|nr:AMP-binding protein [Candidatus Agrococcus pullicola]